MREICRLTIPYTEENGRAADMKKVLDTGFAATGIAWKDIFTVGERPTHFGNWVLVPCAHNDATKKLAAYWGTKIDMVETVIEESDIKAFEVGDKVKVRMFGMLGMFEEEGKVLRIEENQLVILKKRSRSKGWRIAVNDQAGVWKLGGK